jgi:hypothetical protein
MRPLAGVPEAEGRPPRAAVLRPFGSHCGSELNVPVSCPCVTRRFAVPSALITQMSWISSDAASPRTTASVDESGDQAGLAG